MQEEPRSAASESAAGPRPSGRLALACAVLIVGVVATVLIVGGSGHRYRLLFQTGGQLVPGNEVLVGGAAVGKVTEISLTDDSQAAVAVELDEPIREGTTAVIRTNSLAGVANRYVALQRGPNNAPALPDGATLTGEYTTAPVDVDQLFHTFDRPTRRSLDNLVAGFSTIYAGNSAQANRTYEYLAPGLQSAQRLLAELNRDERDFGDFISSASAVFGGMAKRRADLSALTENTNRALGAIAGENRSLDRTLTALPGTLRQASTTLHNVRPALDDLDPVVATASRVTPDIEQLSGDLLPVTRAALPVTRDLRLSLNRAGGANDLNDLLGELPALRAAADRDLPTLAAGLDDTRPSLAELRPYAPDLFGLIGSYAGAMSNYDGNGHYARVGATGMNPFRRDSASEALIPIPPSEQLDGFDSSYPNRCPGGSTQPLPGSNPFLDSGTLDGVCNPLAVPPGP